MSVQTSKTIFGRDAKIRRTVKIPYELGHMCRSVVNGAG